MRDLNVNLCRLSLFSNSEFTCSRNSSDLTNVAWSGGKGPAGCAFTHA